jgi:endonuclease/exonuclease/phosphatase family metal-dependent hydrolase
VKRLLPILCACAIVASAFVPASAAAPAGRTLGSSDITGMTRNLFLGTGLEPLFGVSTPAGLAVAVSQLWANVQATDFRQRAVEIADEIARTQPDVIGLQEAVLWQTQAPSDGTATPATGVVFDFIEILRAELQKRGLSYAAVAVGTNTELEFPLTLSNIDIRFTDRDALLVRSGLKVTNAEVHPFEATLTIPVSGTTVRLPRSWQSVDVEIGGRTVRVANTHLEPANAEVQAAQAKEVVEGLEGSPYPVLLLGDFNSKADRSGTPTYGLIADAGYTDAWAATHPGEPGLTCCHATSLTNPAPTLDERIDIVFGRGLDPVSAEVVGEDPADRTASGLWPSDHAGVVATFGIPAPDTEVSAALQALAVTSSRAVRATLDVDEIVSLRMELRRGGKLLASKVVARLRAGVRRVTLPVPDSVARGRANVRILLEDGADNKLTLRGSVVLPAPK